MLYLFNLRTKIITGEISRVDQVMIDNYHRAGIGVVELPVRPDDFRVNAAQETARLLETKKTITEISLAQFHAGLRLAGLYDTVVGYIDQMPDSAEKIVIQERFHKSQFFERSNPLFIGLAQKLGISEVQIDSMFEAWAKL